MCPSLSDHELYFYYVADKYKRISEDWTTCEYIVFTLLIGGIVFIWCDIVNEHENEVCSNPCTPICSRIEAATSNTAISRPCNSRNRACSTQTERPRTRSPVRRSLRLCNNALNTTSLSTNRGRPLLQMIKSTNKNNKSSNHCCYPLLPPTTPQTPPLRRSLRLQRIAEHRCGPGSSNSNVSKVSINTTELMYCGEWCQRREHERAREKERKNRSRSRSRR